MTKKPRPSLLPALNEILPDWFTGKDVREIQGPVYIPPRGTKGGYRKEMAWDVARGYTDPFTQRNVASGVMAGADLIPVVGDVTGAEETKEDWQKGNYLAAGLGAAGTLVSAAPLIGDAAAVPLKAAAKALRRADDLPAPGGLLKGIRAYHGSPHSFEEFDISKIGTGEGAQAYGHGLYFAENEKVAQDYRDKLSRQTTFKGQPLGTHPMDSDAETAKHSIASKVANGEDPRGVIVNEASDWRQAAEGYARHARDKNLPEETRQAAARQAESFNRVAAEIEKFDPTDFAKNPGHMYEVNIAADPEAFLDWDKPLSEQPRNVRDWLADQRLSKGPVPIPDEDKPASWLFQGGRGTGGDVEAQLRDYGIPGIRYLDQGSRTAGDGSRNYVVFDPKLISIVKKYGLAGALAAGLISQDQAEAMQRQGLGGEAEAAPAPVAAPPRSSIATLDERVMDEAYATRSSPRDVLKRLLGLE